MKKYMLTLVFALSLCSFALAQASDQNPRAQEAYQAYEVEVDSTHAASLGATVDKTYEAYDPILIKQQRKEDRREFRRELRLERARNQPFLWRQPYGYYRYW
ncbi:MAG: hypothetical protein H6557_14345 [Lewinellaceae bacterium]|nr:hypothetical protein [Phaeodactylibacter sp.]MCB9037791.1 hypothetical protein [Lewinellaceae bacterium]